MGSALIHFFALYLFVFFSFSFLSVVVVVVVFFFCFSMRNMFFAAFLSRKTNLLDFNIEIGT